MTVDPSCLPNVALGLGTLLLALLDVNGTPDQDADNHQGNHGGTSDGHETLDMAEGRDDGVTDRVTNGVRQLLSDVTVEDRRQVLAVGRKLLVQLLRNNVGPQTTGNGETDGRSDGTEHTPERESNSNFLVVDRGHDSNLTADGPNASANTVKELAHDEVADVSARVTEVDEQSGTEEHEGHTAHGRPLVLSSVADTPMIVRSFKTKILSMKYLHSDKGPNERGGQRECVQNVTSVGNAEVVDNLEVGLVVGIPSAIVCQLWIRNDKDLEALTRLR